ncbi:MAG: glutamate--tRNA ligase [Clostridia bacterium]|nr:glutamate--tRNA ligase [Clostridia bacterium]
MSNNPLTQAQCEALAEKLFPKITKTPEYYAELYPERNLPEGAQVTRIAPSPTGFIHLGNLFSALADERIARQSKGVFYLRIEDTDLKRKVDGAVEAVISTLGYFGITFDEGAETDGDQTYGPFYQRQRELVYKAYVKRLLAQGLAYPCFCTAEDLDEIREKQRELKLTPGYYGEWARCRGLSYDEIVKKLDAGTPYVIRMRSAGDGVQKYVFRDSIKGEISVTANNRDEVILKSDGIPTYHFAHAIDDHLMHTTLVLRGEEWLSSLPIHLELFRMLGFKAPKYGHHAQLMKIDNGTKRKLSKRKDPELALEYYRKLGYHPLAVKTYLMTLLNSNFEEWWLKNPDGKLEDFKFSIGKMGQSGALFDIPKLDDVSKTVISKLTSEEFYDFLLEWANNYEPDFEKLLADKEYVIKVLDLCMGAGKKRRKDFVCASQAVELLSYYFDETFKPERDFPLTPDIRAKILTDFLKTYDYADDGQTWFAKVKDIAASYGFATDMRAYKENPDAFPGSVSDVAEVLRVAVTGHRNTPDLWSIMQLLGKERSVARIKECI